jgi:serine protease DegQ
MSRTWSGISVLATAAAAIAFAPLTHASSPQASSSPSRAQILARPVPMSSFAQIVERVLPSVVSIKVVGETLVPARLQPHGPTPQPTKRAFKSGGSGVIVDAGLGLIATNNHVVRDAISILVGLHDGREVPATLLGIDSGTDIAVIKVDITDLTAVSVGNSADLRVGDFVIAIGNPYGLEGTATAGIVSGLMRSGIGYDIYESFIQVDAAVNPGNSGGALVNLDGELVGINTAVGRHGNSAVGIAFAIPVNIARRVGAQLHKHGRMRRGSLGLETQDISSSLAVSRNLPTRRGALVSRVAPGSPAARGGISPGCIIVAVNGEPIRNSNDFKAHFAGSVVGDELELQILSHEAPRAHKLTITDQFSDPASASISGNIRGLGGLTVSNISPRSPLYGQVSGVVVTNVEQGGPADTSGLRPDDIILSVNDLTINEASRIMELVHTTAQIERASIIRRGAPYIVDFGR